MPPPLVGTLRRFGKPRINRAPSPILAVAAPWVLVLFGSLSPMLPLVASAPVMPPFGFLLLVAWQQLRPGLFPAWAGLPLGLFDDLYSGQPLGSAVLLWSITMICIDVVEARFPWRGFALNWLFTAGIIATYLVLALDISNLAGAHVSPVVLLPQLAVSILCYPLAARLVSGFDRFRLIPIRAI